MQCQTHVQQPQGQVNDDNTDDTDESHQKPSTKHKTQLNFKKRHNTWQLQ
eukprot:m.11269 g.11269  ORF g.11269 m.11269 type:complete len:50 (+) comp2834_c0_seq1:1002-1151(+)